MQFPKRNVASPWSPLVLPPPLCTPARGCTAQPNPTTVRCWMSPMTRARARDVTWYLAHATPPHPDLSPRLHTQQVGSQAHFSLELLALEWGPNGLYQRQKLAPACPPQGWYESPGWKGLPRQPWPCARESKVTLGVIKGKVLTCRLKDIT